MKPCPNCGEEWPSTASVCTCGTSLQGVATTSLAGRPDRSGGTDEGGRTGPSTMQIVIAVTAVLALVPTVVILARTLPFGDGAPAGVDVPGDAPEAQPDQLPDRRERPTITCSGPNVADDCIDWVFTLPGNAFVNYTLAVLDIGVAVRMREDLWLLDPATGEQRWHRPESTGNTAADAVWIAGTTVALEAPDGFRTLDVATGEPAAVVTLDDDIFWMGSDDQRMVTVTRTDDAIVQGWDPVSGDLLWTTPVDVPAGHDLVNTYWHQQDQLTVTTLRPNAEDAQPRHITLDTSTGRTLDDQETDLDIRPFPARHVFRVGNAMSGGGFDGTVEWQRDLDEIAETVNIAEGAHPIPITRDHVALSGRDHDFLVIDARTGHDTAHIQLHNGRIRSRTGPWRPWSGAQGLLLQVETSDAQHVVLLTLPMD